MCANSTPETESLNGVHQNTYQRCDRIYISRSEHKTYFMKMHCNKRQWWQLSTAWTNVIWTLELSLNISGPSQSRPVFEANLDQIISGGLSLGNNSADIYDGQNWIEIETPLVSETVVVLMALLLDILHRKFQNSVIVVQTTIANNHLL